ncbi:MAG: hypothetical protein A2452_06750 [Candidatus Firestonebacteria bacterium RIFOXYC2_FULL_39_67]|nr:MAG: hypothetical protein A2452_06750 [Candidatus Firestonebacteria bacterium RIFOXYC2_FULL_39_67]
MLKKFCTVVCLSVLFASLLSAQDKPAVSTEVTPERMVSEKVFFQLDEVVVTGSRIDRALRESPGSIAIVNDDKVNAGGDKNVGYAISDIAGVDSSKVGFTGHTQTVMIRGVSSEGTLVLLNGAPMNSSYQGTVDLSVFNLDNVERVEVLKGPASSLYGADAVGGVINVITKDKVVVPSLDLTSLYGSFGTKDIRFGYSGNISGLSLNLAGSSFQTDGIRDNSDVISNDLTGSVYYEFGKNHTIKMNFGAYKSESGSPGYLGNLFSPPTPLDRQQSEKASLGLDYRLPLGENSDLKLKVSGMKNILNFHASTYETLSEERDFFTEAAYTYDFGGINSITLGVSGDYGVLEQNALGWHNAATKSLFAQDTLNLLSSWVFTSSARYDSNTVYGGSFNPMFSLLCNIENGVQVKASYGTSFRAPTFSDLFWPSDMFSVGNPSLLPETATSWEAGLNLEFGKNATLTTTYFNNRIKNLIQWVPVDPTYATSWQWTPSNVGEAEMYGVEAELKMIPMENLDTFISYTWLKATDLTANMPLIYRANNKANAGVSYQFCGSKLSVDAEYYDIRPASAVVMLPSFITLNAKLNMKVSKEMELIVSCNNITDTAYELRQYYPMPGRSFNGGIKISF